MFPGQRPLRVLLVSTVDLGGAPNDQRGTCLKRIVRVGIKVGWLWVGSSPMTPMSC